VNVTPLGSAPLSLSVGCGTPVAVTVNVPELLTLNVVLFALVIAGAVPVVWAYAGTRPDDMTSSNTRRNNRTLVFLLIRITNTFARRCVESP
jgi:hypothetical protein